jgi:hypothetical protein
VKLERFEFVIVHVYWVLKVSKGQKKSLAGEARLLKFYVCMTVISSQNKKIKAMPAVVLTTSTTHHHRVKI